MIFFFIKNVKILIFKGNSKQQTCHILFYNSMVVFCFAVGSRLVTKELEGGMYGSFFFFFLLHCSYTPTAVREIIIKK